MADYEYSDIAKMIDHSLLSPTLAAADLDAGIDLAIAYQVASVCIMPYYLKRCADRLRGTGVAPSTTIGFPHGGHTPVVKKFEAEQALADGCQEFDMVVNISKVLSAQWDDVAAEIAGVTQVAHGGGQRIKVIFENAYLNDAQKIRLCEICSELKVDWVKTSSGYAPSGATTDDLKLMRKHAGPEVQVKAAGGIRDLDSLLKVRQIGVTRCGASGTAGILDEARERLGMPKINVAAASGGDGNSGY